MFKKCFKNVLSKFHTRNSGSESWSHHTVVLASYALGCAKIDFVSQNFTKPSQKLYLDMNKNLTKFELDPSIAYALTRPFFVSPVILLYNKLKNCQIFTQPKLFVYEC